MKTIKLKLAIATTFVMIVGFVVVSIFVGLGMHLLFNYFDYIVYFVAGLFVIGVLVRLWKDIYNEVEKKIEEKGKDKNGEENRIQCNHNSSGQSSRGT